MRIDAFGVYVRAELDHWGREFALHRACDYLGHHTRNLLQVLIDHKGDMPGRAQGFKPMETDARAQLIEDIVASIAIDNVAMACALRAYHCGKGRRKIERFETAIMLMANCDERPVSNRQYLNLVELGFQRVRGRLEAWSHVA